MKLGADEEITLKLINRLMKRGKEVTRLVINANDLLRDVLETDISKQLRQDIIAWKQEALIVSNNIKEDYDVN